MDQNRGITIEQSLWLVPAEPLKSRLREIIWRLATTHDAIEFEPHLTVFCGPSDDNATIALAQYIAAMFPPLELLADKLAFTSVYTKTLFVQFNESAIARRICTIAKERSARPSTYEFNPHLSLLYKMTSPATLSEICRSLAVPLGSYYFDRIRAVETEIPLTAPEQIRKWRILFDGALR